MSKFQSIQNYSEAVLFSIAEEKTPPPHNYQCTPHYKHIQVATIKLDHYQTIKNTKSNQSRNF